MTDAPRLISRKEASAYCGITPTCFSMWVAQGKMPPAIPGTRKWDRKAIDAKLDEISGLAALMEEPQSGAEPPPLSNYEEWKIKKQKRREKYRPQLGLDRKLERVLIFMANHSECETLDEIPLAGPAHIQLLIKKGVVRVAGKTGGEPRYALTDDGKAEAKRIVKWWEHFP